MKKMSKVNYTQNDKKFRNLSHCPCNTQWLTTENAQLFKTVKETFHDRGIHSIAHGTICQGNILHEQEQASIQ